MTPGAQQDLATTFADIAPKLGLSRPAGQCFAAIWSSAEAISADDLVARLGLSRSNVSTALKELRDAGLVQLTRIPASRREFYVATSDPWELLRQIIADRQRRNLAPMLDRLRQHYARAPDPKLAELRDMAEAVTGWVAALARREPGELAAFFGAGATAPRKKKKKKG